MQLRQSEQVCVPDKDGVCPRDVEAVFDDVGGQQDVAVASGERHDRFIHGRCWHLPMRNADRKLRNALAQSRLDLGDILDARDNDKALPATSELAHQRDADGSAVEGRKRGADGQTPARRRRQQAHLLDPDHRRLQCPGDGCRRHGKHMQRGRKLGHGPLLSQSEAVFFIDDEKGKACKVHILGQDRLGRNDDAKAAFGERCLYLLCLGSLDEPR